MTLLEAGRTSRYPSRWHLEPCSAGAESIKRRASSYLDIHPGNKFCQHSQALLFVSQVTFSSSPCHQSVSPSFSLEPHRPSLALSSHVKSLSPQPRPQLRHQLPPSPRPQHGMPAQSTCSLFTALATVPRLLRSPMASMRL
jgi:hypothetical protein